MSDATAVTMTEAAPRSGAEVWLDVVTATIGLLRVHALRDVTVETAASAAGHDLQDVVALFPTFDDLLIAVIQVWNAERMEPIAPLAGRYGAVAFLRAIVLANRSDPALMRVLTATVHLSATPEHPLAPLLQQLWMRFHAMVQRTLAEDVRVGREPATMDPARGAEQLIAMYEGLQLQSMLRPTMDVVGSYDRAVTRLRDGWSHAYTPPVWEI